MVAGKSENKTQQSIHRSQIELIKNKSSCCSPIFRNVSLITINISVNNVPGLQTSYHHCCTGVTSFEQWVLLSWTLLATLTSVLDSPAARSHVLALLKRSSDAGWKRN